MVLSTQVAAADELASNALALSHYQTNSDADEVGARGLASAAVPAACALLMGEDAGCSSPQVWVGCSFGVG